MDDLGLLGAVIDRPMAERVADPRRVFVAGASRGGLMAWNMACEMPGRVVTAAPLITGMTDGQLGSCRPAALVPPMTIAGTEDRVQSYDGWLTPDYRLLSVPETMEFRRRLHGCAGQTGRVLPHREGTKPTRVTLIGWMGCSTDGPLRLYRIQGGGHQLPSLAKDLIPPPRWAGAWNRHVETAEEIWQFFTASESIRPAPLMPDEAGRGCSWRGARAGFSSRPARLAGYRMPACL